MKVLLATLFLAIDPNQVSALASVGDTLSRGRVFEALASPSGKLTISPEFVIPEPNDPTAILLQTNAVNTLSERIRNSKANAAWISGSISAVKTFCAEQANSRGNFPGPLPVIYCNNNAEESESAADLAEAGASGVVVPVCGGMELDSIDAISSNNNDWVRECQTAIDYGIQPIPEVTLADALSATMVEEDVERLVEAISTAANVEPVAVLLTMNPPDSDDGDENEQEAEVSIPKVSKALGRKVPILGSVRVTAGENRLGIESQRFKEAGMTGVVLRSDCVPGFRLNPDLEVVGLFWSACIGDLKSTRSKSFQFNSRNNMEKNMGAEWAKYQSNVVDSGALGDPNDSHSIVDEAAGEYKGFA